MASVATRPSKASLQCRYFDGSVLKSTCTRSPVSAMTPLAQDDPERLGLFATEILPPVGHAAVEERAVARLEQVAVAVVVERNLALQDVEELQLARLDDDLLGREAARLRTERRDHRADLALKEAGAEYGPPLRRPIERHHRVVALVRDDDAAGRLAVEERGDRHAEGRGDLAEGVERGREPARFDLRDHAGRQARLLRELALLQLALAAQPLDALAERRHATSSDAAPASPNPATAATATPSTGKSNEPRRRSFKYTERQPSAGGSWMSATISSGRLARYSIPSS